jgi:aromatic-L-amino-acid decarboxylase
LRRINEDGRIHMVPSESKGVYYLRFAVCSALTEAADIQFAWHVIQELAEKQMDTNSSVLADN